MSVEDEYKHLIGAYYGMQEMDEYDLKVYYMEKLEKMIRTFISNYPSNINYKEKANQFEKELSLRTKLQDILFLAKDINIPLELILSIKKKLSELEN